VVYFADCPNWREAGQRLRHALDLIGRPDTEISFVRVETDAEAAGALRLLRPGPARPPGR